MNIDNPKNTILLVGYCEPHSLGGRLMAGQKEVKIYSEMYEVRCHVASIRSMSAHGDYEDLMQFLACQAPHLVKQIYEQLTETEEYKDYIALLARDKKSEKDILQYIFTHLMLPNEEFISHIEELFMNWDDDGEMMNLLMQNFLQKYFS